MSLDFYLDHDHIFNITHNLNTMAEHCGLYGLLWHPEGDIITAHLNHDSRVVIEEWTIITGNYKKYTTAEQMIPDLVKGLASLKKYPSYYQQYNPSNGWGTYENLVECVEKLLDACYQNPSAIPSASR